MELLIRVAETGSMTTAAHQMRLTPAAVSAAIGRIEQTMGVRLFERTTRTIHLTEEGLAVFEGCQDVVKRWHKVLENVQGATTELTGTIHVSAPADTTYQILASTISVVSRAHPKLKIVVHSSDALQHLHRDAIDMAIRYGILPDSTLLARKLTELPNILVASPSYVEKWGQPKKPDELLGHKCLTLQLSSMAASSWTLEKKDGSKYEIRLQSQLCGDGYLARQWAIAGLGIARKSLFDVIDDLESNRLVQVLPDYVAGTSPIHVVFPSRRYQPARVRALDSVLTAEFAARCTRCDQWLLKCLS